MFILVQIQSSLYLMNLNVFSWTWPWWPLYDLCTCREAGNQWALEEAKRNVLHHYLVVGVTEKLRDFLAVLEATLPRFFKGASDLYAEGKLKHSIISYSQTLNHFIYSNTQQFHLLKHSIISYTQPFHLLKHSTISSTQPFHLLKHSTISST